MIRQLTKSNGRFTGRSIATVPETASKSNFIKKARTTGGLRIASIRDYKSNFSNYKEAFNTGDGIFFDNVGVLVVNNRKEENLKMVSKSITSLKQPMITEPERYVYALQAAVSVPASKKKSIKFGDNNVATWGIQATKSDQSPFTGKGMKIAVLDTGMFKAHPDFTKRTKTLISKVSGTLVKPLDKDGHGTHCIGVSMGNTDKNNLRYGVASGASIFSVKVLDDTGRGVDGDIIAGINWAIENKCRIVSMSLGGEADFGDEYSIVYENAAKRAMEKGTIIIAAAGNESLRSKKILRPIGHPANCPSIMAVAAVDSNLKIADFSCTSDVDMGAQIDIAAPGVGIFSSFILPSKYEFLDGTSMATPFVAGIAALYLEQKRDLTPLELWSKITQNAKRLTISSVDVGAGLIQAPIT